MSSTCIDCFTAAGSDADASKACYTCTPPTTGCVCTNAQVAEIVGSNPTGVPAGCWKCAAEAGDSTGSVCADTDCVGNACTCSSADTSVIVAAAPSPAPLAQISPECLKCITADTQNSGGDGTSCLAQSSSPSANPGSSAAAIVGAVAPILAAAVTTIGALFAF